MYIPELSIAGIVMNIFCNLNRVYRQLHLNPDIQSNFKFETRNTKERKDGCTCELVPTRECLKICLG